MTESSEIIIEYKHFLTYDQDCFDGFEYGLTDLFYKIRGSTLFIKKVDHSNNTETELEFPVETKTIGFKVVLEAFLINLMSFRYNFVGTPEYKYSEVFSKESFDTMLEKGIALMGEKEKLAKVLNANNEIIKYCESIGLYPEPEEGSSTNWRAQCPSGGQHHIRISTESNEWGCGYCGKKGDINSLKDWYQSKIKIV